MTKETLEELQRRAHSGQWDFDQLLEWYYKLKKELDILQERNEELLLGNTHAVAEVERLRTKTHCAYCSQEFPADGSSEAVDLHIATCPKHPMRAAETARDAALAEVAFYKNEAAEWERVAKHNKTVADTVLAERDAALAQLAAEKARAEKAEAALARDGLYVVFTGPPGPGNECVFVEVEDMKGNGAMVNHATGADGYWRLGPFPGASDHAVAEAARDSMPALEQAIITMHADRDWWNWENMLKRLLIVIKGENTNV